MNAQAGLPARRAIPVSGQNRFKVPAIGNPRQGVGLADDFELQVQSLQLSGSIGHPRLQQLLSRPQRGNHLTLHLQRNLLRIHLFPAYRIEAIGQRQR